MKIKNNNFLVYGGGISGISAYKFLQEHGANVYMFSDKITDDIKDLNLITNLTQIENMGINYAVLSPGVQIIGNKNIKKIKDLGIMLMSELELGYIFSKGKFIAVTGTNGKTTCTSLLGHILSNIYNVFVCGNIGIPITSICDKTDDQSVVICEVSSFMLELVSPNFSPDISVICNITPDHISRHKTFEEYYQTKCKITAYQNNNNYLVVPNNLSSISTSAQKVICSKIKFKTKLLGSFNQENLNLCYSVCKLLGMSKKEIQSHIKEFNPVEFRLQKIGKRHGITYINDSKSTNPDSTIKAIDALNKNVVVLLGGSDKGNDFYDVFKCKKIKLALIYGETANKLEEDAHFVGFYKIAKFNNLQQTLYHLNGYVKRGDVVLLSPACASYDEFKNYVERGNFFNKYFKELQ